MLLLNYMLLVLKQRKLRGMVMKMNENEAILMLNELILSKINLFLEYEKLTDKLLVCEADDLLEVVGQRQNISSEIDMIDSKLSELYKKSDNELLKAAALNKLAFGECPKQLESVFLNSQKMFSIISIIGRKEEQVTLRVEIFRDNFLAQIKEQNSGGASKAAKYYTTSKNLEQKVSLFDNKY